jgi:hypothetical protein
MYNSKGFIYGVGAQDSFLKAAKMSALSVKDHYPEANITLCAPPRMVDAECKEIFDNIISNEHTPDSIRTKLWALARTPYDLTMYLDADTQCMSEEISTVWDQIEDHDIMFTKIRLYNSNPRGVVDDPDYQYHGGVFLYNRKCIPMMAEWWDRWQRGQTEWDYPYTANFRHWDQFYLYYILKFTDHGLNVGVFKDDARWNNVAGYLSFELQGKPEIIRHCTIGRKKEGTSL